MTGVTLCSTFKFFTDYLFYENLCLTLLAIFFIFGMYIAYKYYCEGRIQNNIRGEIEVWKKVRVISFFMVG